VISSKRVKGSQVCVLEESVSSEEKKGLQSNGRGTEKCWVIPRDDSGRKLNFRGGLGKLSEEIVGLS